MLIDEDLAQIERGLQQGLPVHNEVVTRMLQTIRYLERIYEVAWAAIPETDHFTFARLARLKESQECR